MKVKHVILLTTWKRPQCSRLESLVAAVYTLAHCVSHTIITDEPLGHVGSCMHTWPIYWKQGGRVKAAVQ